VPGDGIGRATALAAAAHGATVVLLGRSVAKLKAVYDAIEQAGGAQPAIYPIDFEGATAHDFAVMGERLDQAFRHLDGVVHCAATFPYLSRIDDYEPETWGKVLQVNLSAPFMLTQACLPLLRRSQDASMVFLSDTVGRHGRAYWGAYAVSKFGLEGLMQTLADELAQSASGRTASTRARHAPTCARRPTRSRTPPTSSRRRPSRRSCSGCSGQTAARPPARPSTTAMIPGRCWRRESRRPPAERRRKTVVVRPAGRRKSTSH